MRPDLQEEQLRRFGGGYVVWHWRVGWTGMARRWKACLVRVTTIGGDG